MSLLSRIFARRHFAAILCAILLPTVGLLACGETPQLPNQPKSDGAAAPEKPEASVDSQPEGGEGDVVVAAPEDKPQGNVGRHYKKKAAPKSSTSDEAESAVVEEEPFPAGENADVAEATPPSPVTEPEAAAPGAGSSSDNDGLGMSGTGKGGGGTSYGGGIGRGIGGAIGKGSSGPAAAAPKKEEPFEVVPVYYGTDREVEPNTKRLEYGSQRAHKLQMGRALVTVPTAHKVPNIERPWVIEIPYFKYKIYEEKEDPAKHFTMQEIAALTKEQLLVHVRERIAASRNFKDHAFVFVHGFNTSFDSAIYRTAQIAYDLDFDGAPFVYSWPSGGKIASYTYDRASAEQAEPHLAEFLDFVIKETGAKSISLIAHSMGNEVLLRVLERMRLEAPEGVHISQVILAAPDVDRDKFTNIAKQIASFANGVTLYAASNDRALETSARFWGGVPRAGDVPAGGPLVINGVDTIDVTAVSTETLSLNHSSYAENKRLLDDIKMLLLTGQRPPDKREPFLETVKSAAGTFWRYPSVIPDAAVPTGAVP